MRVKKVSEDNSAVVDPSSLHARYVTPVLFTVSILLSAGLLFLVQPLLTRMITPLIGGASGVWTTATLFFQAMMIGGYLYAHLITRLPRIRHQIGLHLMLWLLASSALPLAIPSGWEPDLNTPIQTQTLTLYAITVGLPFFFLSANAPLIQTWYGRTRGPSAHDPYFLYGASNVGSLVALIGFPLIAEPIMGISSISMGWSIGFIALGGLLFVSVLWTTRDHPDAKTVLPIIDRKSDMKMLFTWGAIAFVPSSLMIALTTKITSDFGSFPLLWVIPLAVYLLTYIGGFQTRPLLADTIMVWLYPTSLAVLAVLGMTGFFGLITILSAGIMVLAFAIVALHLHRTLYLLRPDPSRLTVFYLTLSIGGAAGGFFNAIIAPSLMKGMYEFSLTILAAVAVLLVINDDILKSTRKNSQFTTILCITLLAGLSFKPEVFALLGSTEVAVFAILCSCLMLIFTPTMRAGLGIMVVVTMSSILSPGSGYTIETTRNFFGVHTVFDNGKIRGYLNGTTIHGAVELKEGPPEPLFYYRSDGPLADIARSKAWTEADRLGLVGLGVGSMTAYRSPDQALALYEIDPAVIDMAIDPDLFGFLSHYAEGAELFIGDARISLQRQEANGFGVLLIDAYSSDAIPLHLTTIEAMEVFLEDLKPDGVLGFHISNRYYDLRIPIGAAAAHLGLKVYQRVDPAPDPDRIGYNSWINALAVVRPGEIHDFLTREGSRWKEVSVDPSLAWSDDKASPMNALK